MPGTSVPRCPEPFSCCASTPTATPCCARRLDGPELRPLRPQLPYLPVHRDDLRKGSGVWVTPRLILNKPFTERAPASSTRRNSSTSESCAGAPRTRSSVASTTASWWRSRPLVECAAVDDADLLGPVLPSGHGPAGRRVVTSQRTGGIAITALADGQCCVAGYDLEDWNVISPTSAASTAGACSPPSSSRRRAAKRR